ncbi:MAG: DedA family protein [Gammaproteobacteria bacterium]|nr:DedA family protein [Gammaproteobacteria bacterium]
MIFTKLYDRVLLWAEHRYAVRYLGALSFAESSFFPIPPDVMLAPMVLAQPQRAWRYALVTTLASTLGGVAGYLLGYFGFGLLQPWLVELGYADKLQQAMEWFDLWGIWVVLLAGFSPIPYKLFTISAGVLVMNLPLFILASAVGRGARFYLVAGAVRWGGPRMEPLLRQYVEQIGWLLVLLVGVTYLIVR